MKKFSILFFLATLVLFSIGCGGDDPDDPPAGCDTVFAQTFNAELDDISTAAANYSNDPSAENCNALKDAYNDYLDALEDWEDCANFYNQFDEWQAALDAARQSVENIC